MAQLKPLQIGFVTVLLFLLGWLTYWLLSRESPTSSSQTPANPDQSPSPGSVINSSLRNAGYSARFAAMWVAVSKFETGNFTSRLCKEFKNLFGMSYPTAGKDYGKTTLEDPPGVKHDFSVYPTYADSVSDLIEYLAAFNYPKDFENSDQLVAFMKSKGYFGSALESYQKGVARYLA